MLLDFWAVWCGPCVAELPLLEEFANRQTQREDLPLDCLAVNCDQNFANAVTLAEKRGNHWRQLNAGNTHGEIARSFKVESLPVKFLIGPDGTVLYRGNDLQKIEAILDGVAAALLQPDASAATDTEIGPARVAALLKAKLTPPAVRGLQAQRVDDDYRPTADVDLIWTLDRAYEPGGKLRETIPGGLQFLTAEGTRLRSLPEVTPSGWLARADRIAIDRARGRIAALGSVTETNSTKLTCFSRDGRQLFELALPEMQSIAFDESTGDLWCTLLSQLNQGHLLVLDEQGHEKTRIAEQGFSLRYSPAADGFWLIGNEARLISRDGTVRATASLPARAYTFSAVAVDNAGGCWAIETAHPDVPLSRSRLWHFDRNGEQLGQVEFPRGQPSEHPRWVEVVGDEAWVGVWQTRTQEDLTDAQQRVRRYGSAGNLIEELPLPARAGATTGDGNAIWLLCPDQARLFGADGSELRTFPAPELPQGVYQSAWILAF